MSLNPKYLLIAAFLVIAGLGLFVFRFQGARQNEIAENAMESPAVSANSVVSEPFGDEPPPELLQAQAALQNQEFERAEELFFDAWRKYPDSQIGPSSTVESDAREAISYIRCLRLANPEVRYFTSDVEALKEIMAAISAKDFLKIFHFTGCSFAVGYAESDHFWNLQVPDNLQALVNRLLPLAQSNWTSAPWSTETQKFLETKLDERKFVLHFAKQPEGWKWNGFFLQPAKEDQLSDLIWSGNSISLPPAETP